MNTDYKDRLGLTVYISLFFTMVISVACSPATTALPPTTVPSQAPTHSAPVIATATEASPSPTNTSEATLIATAPPMEPVESATPPLVLPTRRIFQPPAAYTCPWVEQAQTTPVYTFRVVNVYPHDSAAYTQGLIYRNGFLYEGTGLNGQSSLRKVDLETGEVQQAIELPQQYFGEGITELDDKIYQLTWREQTGFIYDFSTFEQLNTFSYPTEGWGLTHDGQYLIMSDGSPNLYSLDPGTLEKVTSSEVQAEGKPVPRLNELEYVEGEVWANVYQTSCIARIDPANGQVIGWIDIGGILAPEDWPGSEVPNGIAYDPAGKRIFVTGKLWPKLFEILVVPTEN